MSNLEGAPQRPVHGDEESQAGKKALDSKVRDLAQQQAKEISATELDSLIAEISGIQGKQEVETVYGLLVDLRIALFRPELDRGTTSENADEVLDKLRLLTR